MGATTRSGKRGDGGATAVEFAMVAPILFLLIFGLIEGARAITSYTAVSTAAREGARMGTTMDGYLDCDAIRSAVRSKTPHLTLDDSSIDIVYDDGSGAIVADCQGGTAPSVSTVESEDRVKVTVRTQFRSAVPLLSSLIGTHMISDSQARTIQFGLVDG